MSKSLSACAIAIGLLFAGLDSASSANAPLEKLTVNVFPGGFNWPLFVARDKGFFAQQGLEVDGAADNGLGRTNVGPCIRQVRYRHDGRR